MKKFIDYLPFIALFFLPLLFYPAANTSGWIGSSDIHASLEFGSSLLAITAGLMVLLHFFTTGRRFFLIIAIGFVLIGAEEFVHAVFSFNRIWPEVHPTFKFAVSTTWLTGQFVLVLSFFAALIFGEKEIPAARIRINAVVYNIIGFICAAAVAMLIFNSPFLPDFVRIGSTTKKLIELSLAVLYFVVFLFYSNIYLKQRSRSPLLWSIIACIIFRVLVHIFVFNSHIFYDARWDIGHLIVFISYFFPIFGVWGETIKLHKSAQMRVIELAKEVAERKQMEIELKKANKILEMTAQISEDIFIIKNRRQLLAKICEEIVRYAYKMVWIGFCDEKTKAVVPEAQAGFDEGYLESVKITYDDTEYGNGPTGMAIKTKKPSIVRFIDADPKYRPWHREALKRGYHSSAAIPIFYDNRVADVLNVYAQSEDAFSENEVKLLEELGHDISVALNGINEEVLRRQAEKELKQAHAELEQRVEERTAELNATNTILLRAIEEKNHIQKLLRETEKLAGAGKLAAQIAHEINNPIAGIKNAFLLIKGAIPKDYQHFEYVGRIEKEIDRVSQILKQMFDLYRPGSPPVNQFRLYDTINDIVELLKVSRREKQVSIMINCDKKIVVSLSDALLRQVIYNIVLNAVDVSQSGQTIEIAAFADTGRLYILVSDHGPGIDEEIKGKIFDPFFTTGIGGPKSGLGLGLAITRDIILAMDGTIDFKSEKNKGTVFNISIPAKNTREK